MASSSVTLTLEGEIALHGLVDALRKFEALLTAISSEVAASTPIEWMVTDLRAGSAMATISGQSEDLQAPERVVDVLLNAVRSVRDQRHGHFAPRIVRRAYDMETVLTGRIIALRFETDDETIILHRPGEASETTYLGAYGAVDGRIETLTSRRDLRFTLFDTVFDRGVTCSLTEDRRDLIRDAWGHRARVEGWVIRDPFSGRPIAIHSITAINVLDETDAAAYQRARGVLRLMPGTRRPVEQVRWRRNAF